MVHITSNSQQAFVSTFSLAKMLGKFSMLFTISALLFVKNIMCPVSLDASSFSNTECGLLHPALKVEHQGQQVEEAGVGFVLEHLGHGLGLCAQPSSLQ